MGTACALRRMAWASPRPGWALARIETSAGSGLPQRGPRSRLPLSFPPHPSRERDPVWAPPVPGGTGGVGIGWRAALLPWLCPGQPHGEARGLPGQGVWPALQGPAAQGPGVKSGVDGRPGRSHAWGGEAGGPRLPVCRSAAEASRQNLTLRLTQGGEGPGGPAGHTALWWSLCMSSKPQPLAMPSRWPQHTRSRQTLVGQGPPHA